MSDLVLKTHSFFAAVTATTTSPWIPIDYKYSGVQDRSITGFRTDENCPIQLLTKTAHDTFDKNGSSIRDSF